MVEAAGSYIPLLEAFDYHTETAEVLVDQYVSLLEAFDYHTESSEVVVDSYIAKTEATGREGIDK